MNRDQREKEIRDELDFHLDEEQEELQATGLDPERAHLTARREFGNRTLIHEAVRDVWRNRSLDALLKDLRYASRRLWAKRAFSSVAVVTLALAIGAATAVYSFVDEVLFRPLGGISNPQQVFAVLLHDRTREDSANGFSLYHYNELRAAQRSLSDLMGYFPFGAVLATGTNAKQATVEFVTGNFFSGLGIPLIAGRGIDDNDNVPNGPFSVVLSEHIWRQDFGGEQNTLGRTLRLNGKTFTVVGIASGRFEGIYYSGYGQPDVWVAVHAYTPMYGTDRVTRRTVLLNGLGRLKPDIDAKTAEASLSASAVHLTFESTDRTHFNGARLIPAGRLGLAYRQSLGEFLGLLLGISVLILLAACFNIANFLISHGVTRRVEMSLRVALGASRRRLLQQLLTESLLLGVVGGGLGMLLSWFFARLLEQYPPSTTAGYTFKIPVHFDERVGLFGVGITLAATLVMGLMPAILISSRNPIAAIRGASWQWSSTLRRVTSRHVLLGLQATLSVILAITAGLYARSLMTMNAVRYTLSIENVLLTRVDPSTLPTGQRTLFYRDLFSKLNANPEVVSASVASNPPLSIGAASVQTLSETEPVRADFAMLGPEYFRTLQIPIVAGHEFRDVDLSERVVVINQTLADRLWPGENSLGKIVRLPGLPAAVSAFPYTVIGVVNQPRCQDLRDEAYPCVYLPKEHELSFGILHIRTRHNPIGFVPTLRKLVSEFSHDIPLDRITSLEDHVLTLRAAARVSTFMTTGLALLTGVLVGVGCFALLSSLVNEGRREIAVRLALGATDGRLFGRILIRSMIPYLAGIALGTALTWFVATRFVAAQLYHTSPTDPYVFISVPTVLLLVGLAASYWPARTALRTDPGLILRHD